MDEELRQGFLRLTALGIFQSIQITSLQKAVARLTAKSEGIEEGIQAMFWVWKESQKALDEKLAEIADDDPDLAAELKAYLKKYDETKLG